MSLMNIAIDQSDAGSFVCGFSLHYKHMLKQLHATRILVPDEQFSILNDEKELINFCRWNTMTEGVSG